MKHIRNMDVEWSYSGKTGPNYWHTLCDWFSQGAAYPYQSPIHLEKKQAVIEAKCEKIVFCYQEQAFTEKEFKNTFHFVPPSLESYVVFGGEKYYLTDIHFHTPSEHRLNGAQYPVECHLVHMNEAGINLVVGSLFTLTDSENEDTKNAYALHWQADAHKQSFNPRLFLPQKQTYFHYLGSLTTPPTKGPVHWFVFSEIETMSAPLYNRLHDGMLPFNNRPVQPLNGRTVYFYE